MESVPFGKYATVTQSNQRNQRKILGTSQITNMQNHWKIYGTGKMFILWNQWKISDTGQINNLRNHWIKKQNRLNEQPPKPLENTLNWTNEQFLKDWKVRKII